MTYSEAIEYLYSKLPMFHRVGVIAYRADLRNIISLTEKLNYPEKKIRTIHIAGTNGKGSVSNMIASILQEAGYKTGLFTSPHLKDFRERIRINGKMIEEKEVISFIENYRNSFDEISPSFFEWTTALAFYTFAKHKVDVAVIETGLGGRLDSTNIIIPELSVITNISYDHMQMLGDTLEKIAGEKAGIIKRNIPVVVGERQEECDKVFIEKAKEMNSKIIFASDHYQSKFISRKNNFQDLEIRRNNKIIFDNLSLELLGNYQEKNICTVLQTVEILKEKFSDIHGDNIIHGLKNIFTNTGLQGRWQELSSDPLVIADVAHNEAGLTYVVNQLEEIIPAEGNLHVVFGIVNDKDVSKVLSILPKHSKYYFCKADLPRAMDAKELKDKASSFNLSGDCYFSVKAAFNAAKKNAKSGDVVFVGGSTFIVAEIL